MAGYLTFGAFECIQATGEGGAWRAMTLAEGTEWGNPLPIEVAVRSLMQDGAIVFTQGYDNREVNLRVILTAADLVALADAESALFAEIGKRNTLTWTPPGAIVVPTVFDVVTSSLNHVPDDVAEVRSPPTRQYSIRLVCEPFGRSDTEVVTAALAASGSTTTLVDACSSATGWTSTDGTPSVVSGAVGVTTAALSGTQTVDLTRTGSITTSSTKYLQVDWRANTNLGPVGFVAFGDGVALAKVANQASPTAGYTRTTFYVAASSVAAVRFEATTSRGSDVTAGTATRTLFVDNINRTDIRPSLGTARQLVRTIAVPGSARSQASLTIEHASNALGDVIAYVYPDDESPYVPALRQFRTSGASTTDTALVSGAYDNLDTQLIYDIPQSYLPDGRYLVMARLTGTDVFSTTLNWTAQPRIGSTAIGATQSNSTAVSVTGAAYAFYVLGVLNLPLTRVSDSSLSTLRLTIVDATIDANDVRLDEMYLFNLSVGQLVQVTCGTGTAASGGPSRRLFINPATVDNPTPSVLRGHAADGTDAFYPGADLAAWEAPMFTPPSVRLFTVTSNTLDASASARAWPRWHTHAAS